MAHPPSRAAVPEWKKWLPAKHRRLELIILGVLTGLFGFYIQLHEKYINELNYKLNESNVKLNESNVKLNESSNRILAQQRDLQQKMNGLIDEKSQTAMVAALVPYLTCSTNFDIRRMAIKILEETAPDKMQKLIAPILPICTGDSQRSDAGVSVDREAVKGRAATAAIESDFVKKVKYGKQYYDDHLWERAARTWYEAMDLIPEAAVTDKVISLQDVADARAAFERGDFVAAADLYLRAYRRAISN